MKDSPNIIDPAKWQTYVEANKNDPYGKAVIDGARAVMRWLDTDTGKLKRGYYPKPGAAHTIICKLAKGLSGAQAELLVSIVGELHPRGIELQRALKP